VPKRKLVKTKTKMIKRSARQRMLVAAVFMVLAVPAGWIAVRADPSDTGSGPASRSIAASEETSTLGAASEPKGNKPMADNSKKPDNAAAPSPAQPSGAAKPQTASPGAAAVQPPPPPPPAPGLHQNIVTTIFWAGELPGPDNGGISNVPSAWDEKWADHFGGYDDPDHRNSYYPAGFTPKENPFYFALPYNDYGDSGQRKASAASCSAVTGNSAPGTSWCKNAWIKIIKGGKTAYAQWQDVGPYDEDDFNYVFGTAAPRNATGARAGLDVSPAVRDYLGLSGVDSTSWAFVSAASVPSGPWKQIVTVSGVYWE
jgi:hypothetical protein